jgi:hypothetical protein
MREEGGRGRERGRIRSEKGRVAKICSLQIETGSCRGRVLAYRVKQTQKTEDSK